MLDETAYKIFQLNEWDVLQSTQVFKGSPVDIHDGYIHLSSIEQVQGTLDKHYTSGAEVVIAEITLTPLRDAIKFEVSRGGAKFPHLYRDLPFSAVTKFGRFKAGENARYKFDPLALNAKDG